MAKKITSLEDLRAVQQAAQKQIDLRSGPKDMRLTVHMGTCGIAAGARDILTAIIQELGGASSEHVSVQQAGCAGLCDREPMITITDKTGEVFRYGRLDAKKARQIIQQHVAKGTPVTELLMDR